MRWIRDAARAPRHRLALHRRRRLLPQPLVGADPGGHGRVSGAQGHELSFMMQVDAEAAAFGELAPGREAVVAAPEVRALPPALGGGGLLLGVRRLRDLQPAEPPRRHQGAEPGEGAPAARQTTRRRGGRRSRAVKEKYRRVCANWHRHGVAVHCGYMIGFPFDGPECGRQSAEWLLDVGVDLASFFVVTPLPGHRGPRQGGARGDDRRLGLQPVRLAAHGVAASAHDAGRGGAGVPRRLPHLLLRRGTRSAHLAHAAIGSTGSPAGARTSMVRQRLYYFYSYRAGRHPMLGGIWQRGVPAEARPASWSPTRRRGPTTSAAGIVSAEGVRLELPPHSA